jgi:hypothetical protein
MDSKKLIDREETRKLLERLKASPAYQEALPAAHRAFEPHIQASIRSQQITEDDLSIRIWLPKDES